MRATRIRGTPGQSPLVVRIIYRRTSRAILFSRLGGRSSEESARRCRSPLVRVSVAKIFTPGVRIFTWATVRGRLFQGSVPYVPEKNDSGTQCEYLVILRSRLKNFLIEFIARLTGFNSIIRLFESEQCNDILSNFDVEAARVYRCE